MEANLAARIYHKDKRRSAALRAPRREETCSMHRSDQRLDENVIFNSGREILWILAEDGTTLISETIAAVFGTL